MSQVVPQSQAADIVFALLDSLDAPKVGLTYADFVLEYRKEDATSFVAKSLTDTAAVLTSGNAETYALADGQTLTVAVDGGPVQTATFNTADFIAIGAATAAEVALVITTDIVGVTAADVGGSVVITTTALGLSASIDVSGGAANAALGFPTTAVVGTQPLTEVGSGVFNNVLGPATITSDNAETYALVDGQTLTVSVDGGAVDTATFNTADFGDIANATAAEVIAVILADVAGITAAPNVINEIVLTSVSTGLTAEIHVTGGTANAALGFSTLAVSGTSTPVEVGSGTYTAPFTALELDTVGALIVKATGGTIQQSITIVNIFAAGTAPTAAFVDVCAITGTVFAPDGQPLANVGISARILAFPTIDGGIGMSTDVITTSTDAVGEFILSVIQGALVEVFIPKMNYRRQVTVPALSTANLFTGIP